MLRLVVLSRSAEDTESTDKAKSFYVKYPMSDFKHLKIKCDYGRLNVQVKKTLAYIRIGFRLLRVGEFVLTKKTLNSVRISEILAANFKSVKSGKLTLELTNKFTSILLP